MTCAVTDQITKLVGVRQTVMLTLTLQRGSTFSRRLPSDCEGISQSPSPTSSSTRWLTFFSLGASCLHMVGVSSHCLEMQLVSSLQRAPPCHGSDGGHGSTPEYLLPA